jgi:hypothetical protein
MLLVLNRTILGPFEFAAASVEYGGLGNSIVLHICTMMVQGQTRVGPFGDGFWHSLGVDSLGALLWTLLFPNAAWLWAQRA